MDLSMLDLINDEGEARIFFLFLLPMPTVSAFEQIDEIANTK